MILFHSRPQKPVQCWLQFHWHCKQASFLCHLFRMCILKNTTMCVCPVLLTKTFPVHNNIMFVCNFSLLYAFFIVVMEAITWCTLLRLHSRICSIWTNYHIYSVIIILPLLLPIWPLVINQPVCSPWSLSIL